VWVTGTIDFDAKMSFHTYFKNVHLTLVKSAPEKSFAKKLFFWDFFGVHILLNKISMKRRMF
jgi:hypothetical protein